MMQIGLLNHRRFFDFSRLLGEKDAPLVTAVKKILADAECENLFHLILPMVDDIDNQWQISFDAIDGYGYDIDEDEKTLFLSSYGLDAQQVLKSPYFAPQVILAMVEGLRMIRHIEWVEGSLETYHPESIMRLGRICVADTITQLLSFAWEARQCGKGDMWKMILCGHYADMATTFQNTLERVSLTNDQDDAALSAALQKTFKQWFACQNRVTECDHNTLNLIDVMLVDEKTPGNRYLEASAVTCLTLMPGGSSYLASDITADIITNPYYISVTDPINQAHLMQIIHDMYTVCIGNVAFRDADLAARFTVLQ